jgi:hypothetical protein
MPPIAPARWDQRLLSRIDPSGVPDARECTRASLRVDIATLSEKYEQFFTESLILAQDERWRRA